MTEQSIFNADPAPQATPVSTPTFTIPTEIEGLVGEGKKYNSVEAALKSVPHAQTHIKTLEDENKLLKEELLKRKTAAEVLDEFKAHQPQQQSYEQPSGIDVDQEALASIVERVLDKKTQQTQAVSNASIVTSKFNEMYGDKAEVMYNKLAQDNGLSVYQLNQLAVTSPSVILNLAGISSSRQVAGRTQSDVNIQPQSQQNQFNTTVGVGATTKQVMSAFAAARAKVEAQILKENK